MLAPYPVAAHGVTPILPDQFRDALRIEAPAFVAAIGRRFIGARQIVKLRSRRILFGRPHEELDKSFQLLAPDAGCRGQLLEGLAQQVPERTTQKSSRQPT